MGRVLGELGPPDNFSPIELIRLLLTRFGEIAHLILRDATEEEEEAGEDALIGGHRYIDRRRNLRG